MVSAPITYCHEEKTCTKHMNPGITGNTVTHQKYVSQKNKSTEKIKIKEPPYNEIVNEAVVDCHQIDTYMVNLNSMARENC